MFALLACLSLAPAQDIPSAFPVPHDPRAWPTRLEHGLFPIGARHVQAVGDLDGDGLSEIVAEQEAGDTSRLVLLRGGTGKVLGRIAEDVPPSKADGVAWRVGPDLDGDGVRDLAVIEVQRGRASVSIRSSWPGERLRDKIEFSGDGPSALVWVDALDEKGGRDLVVWEGEARRATRWSTATLELQWAASFAGENSLLRIQNVGDRSGDGFDDLLADRGKGLGGDALWIDGSTGTLREDALGTQAVFTAIGDLDGDGRTDLVEEPDRDGLAWASFKLRCTGDGVEWTESTYPDTWPDYPWIEGVGDVDGDGVPDLAVGDSNFNLPTEAQGAQPAQVIDLAEATLERALEVESIPRSVAQESGCAWIVSGRTGERLAAVFGEPETSLGIGMRVAGVGDQDGDGHADVAVGTNTYLRVFSAQTPSDDPLRWLPGTWRAERGSDGNVRVSEERWLPPEAGRMHAVSRMFLRGADARESFEYLRIEREEAGFALYAQPGGGPPTRFAESERGPHRIVFSNAEHDFPQRIEYVRIGAQLHARAGTAAEPDRLRFQWDLDG